MSFFQSILTCFGDRKPKASGITEDKRAILSDTDVAHEIIEKLFTTEKHGNALKSELQGIIQANGWREGLAEAIFNATEVAVRNGRSMGPVIHDAYDKAVLALKNIEEFVEENPVLCSIIALGIIALLMPWLLSALGFAEAGITEGKWCSIIEDTC
jgi:hypothetical protein